MTNNASWRTLLLMLSFLALAACGSGSSAQPGPAEPEQPDQYQKIMLGILDPPPCKAPEEIAEGESPASWAIDCISSAQLVAESLKAAKKLSLDIPDVVLAQCFQDRLDVVTMIIAIMELEAGELTGEGNARHAHLIIEAVYNKIIAEIEIAHHCI